MPFDLSTVIPLLVSVLGALGVGSLIGQWVAGGKDRRAARAAVLKELAAVEEARQYREGREVDPPKMRAAVQQLETAALIARIPRTAVLPYVQLATLAFWRVQSDVEECGEPEAVGLPWPLHEALLSAAEIVSAAAWASRATRRLRLRLRVRRLNREVAEIDNAKFRGLIESALQNVH